MNGWSSPQAPTRFVQTTAPTVSAHTQHSLTCPVLGKSASPIRSLSSSPSPKAVTRQCCTSSPAPRVPRRSSTLIRATASSGWAHARPSRRFQPKPVCAASTSTPFATLWPRMRESSVCAWFAMSTRPWKPWSTRFACKQACLLVGTLPKQMTPWKSACQKSACARTNLRSLSCVAQSRSQRLDSKISFVHCLEPLVITAENASLRVPSER